MSQEKSDYVKYLERKGVVILAAEIPTDMGVLVEKAIAKQGVKKIDWVQSAVVAALKAQGFSYTLRPRQATSTALLAAQRENEELRAKLAKLEAKQAKARRAPTQRPSVKADPITGDLVPQA